MRIIFIKTGVNRNNLYFAFCFFLIKFNKFENSG